jgi:hypothetical protein
MGETLIVPESAVLQHQPASRFADSTPAFALIAMTTNPTRRVEVAVEPKLLLVWYKISIGRIHVFRRRWDLLLMERCIEIRWITQISVV